MSMKKGHKIANAAGIILMLLFFSKPQNRAAAVAEVVQTMMTIKMSCKDCRANVFDITTRVADSRRLYNPPVLGIMSGGSGHCSSKCSVQPPHYIRPKCLPDCRKRTCCMDRFKTFWAKNCDPSCLCTYEKQPWYRDPVIKSEWNDFVGDLITPENVHCFMQPGHDEYQYQCHKVRSLMPPCVCCTWDLPDQDECATIRYGYNRDWRRYNEDQRQQYTDFKCGGSGEPVCPPTRCCEYPPYLGKKFGGRYMAWAHPKNFMFPRSRPFNWQSIPTVC